MPGAAVCRLGAALSGGDRGLELSGGSSRAQGGGRWPYCLARSANLPVGGVAWRDDWFGAARRRRLGGAVPRLRSGDCDRCWRCDEAAAAQPDDGIGVSRARPGCTPAWGRGEPRSRTLRAACGDAHRAALTAAPRAPLEVSGWDEETAPSTEPGNAVDCAALQAEQSFRPTSWCHPCARLNPRPA